jgi:hypothetical protein
MSAPTHIEVYIYAMFKDTDSSRLAERGEEPHFYDVVAQEVETDPLHRDWTGEIVVLEEAEDIATYEEAAKIASEFCAKLDLPHDYWEDVGG